MYNLGAHMSRTYELTEAQKKFIAILEEKYPQKPGPLEVKKYPGRYLSLPSYQYIEKRHSNNEVIYFFLDSNNDRAFSSILYKKENINHICDTYLKHNKQTENFEGIYADIYGQIQNGFYTIKITTSNDNEGVVEIQYFDMKHLDKYQILEYRSCCTYDDVQYKSFSIDALEYLIETNGYFPDKYNHVKFNKSQLTEIVARLINEGKSFLEELLDTPEYGKQASSENARRKTFC